MYRQLEDEFGDIIGKARRGQELSLAELARQTGLTEEELARIERYESIPRAEMVACLAQALGLHPGKLQASAEKQFFPLYPNGRPGLGLKVEMLCLGTGYPVNGYLVGCQETGKGAVIDPGNDPEKILRTIEHLGLEIEQVLLTHGHRDHVGALSEVCQATEAPALIAREDLGLLGGLRTKIEGFLVDGKTIAVGNQILMVRCLPGHTEGSVCLIHAQAAFVGDVLFAGSMGGTQKRGDYERLRQGIHAHLLSREDRFTLFPGHGPASTVGEEKAYNPFFC